MAEIPDIIYHVKNSDEYVEASVMWNSPYFKINSSTNSVYSVNPNLMSDWLHVR